MKRSMISTAMLTSLLGMAANSVPAILPRRVNNIVLDSEMTAAGKAKVKAESTSHYRPKKKRRKS